MFNLTVQCHDVMCVSICTYSVVRAVSGPSVLLEQTYRNCRNVIKGCFCFYQVSLNNFPGVLTLYSMFPRIDFLLQ